MQKRLICRWSARLAAYFPHCDFALRRTLKLNFIFYASSKYNFLLLHKTKTRTELYSIHSVEIMYSIITKGSQRMDFDNIYLQATYYTALIRWHFFLLRISCLLLCRMQQEICFEHFTISDGRYFLWIPHKLWKYLWDK